MPDTADNYPAFAVAASRPSSTAAPLPGRRRPTGPIAVGAVVFIMGLISVAVIMALFATGTHDLPLWLNLAAMLAPIGFGIGLIGIVLEARSGRAARALRVAARDRSAGAQGGLR